MNRGMYSNWTPERQRQHRIYRAFHELLAHPKYTIQIDRAKLLPQITVSVREGLDSAMTPEADKFRKTYRAILVEHHEWLEGER